MLPFLEPKKMVSVIVARRGKVPLETSPEVEAPGHELDPGLKAAAEDLMRGIEIKSVVDVAKALQAAYEICESYPEQSSGDSQEE